MKKRPNLAQKIIYGIFGYPTQTTIEGVATVVYKLKSRFGQPERDIPCQMQIYVTREKYTNKIVRVEGRGKYGPLEFECKRYEIDNLLE